jgi:hypothetical protein
MILMPSMAHSAGFVAPTALPTIDIPRIAFPNYPTPLVSIKAPQIQLSAPLLQASLIPAVVPTVAEVAPVAIEQAAVVQASVVEAPQYRKMVPQSVIPRSRIEGISAVRKTRKGAGSALVRLTEANRESQPLSQTKIAALFDGTAKPEPAAVPASPAQTAPTDAYEDTSLTLPESDLADEMGLSY